CVFCWQAKRSIEFFPLPRAFSMTEMPYLCWAFLYTSTGVNSYEHCQIVYKLPMPNQHTYRKFERS
ncbi:hypothetical protein ETB99_14515, partial [Anoxybacillus sp. CHMUD]|nr:hypothetical protein [Anoxybacillus sp. CHMUD]